MACGALDRDGNWHLPARRPNFLFPVEALSCVFRGKFMAALKAARQDGRLDVDPEAEDAAWNARHKALYRHEWVVYAKTPLGGSAQVLEYLSRYTHRTAISNERIVAISDREVVIAVRADDKGGKRRERIEGGEFVRRIMLHVLPTGIKRIRHYGLLASACKTERLAKAREALAMPLANPRAMESARDFMQRVAKIDVLRCPDCGIGTLKAVEVIVGQPRLPSPALAVRRQACRGPP